MRKYILIMALTLFGCSFGCGSQPGPGATERLNYYEYKDIGTIMPPLEYIRVERTDDGIRMEYSKFDEEQKVVLLPDDALEHIDSLFREYGLKRLKESYRPRVQILDGTMWHVYFGYEENPVSSGGSNAWPSGRHWAGISAINAWLRSQMP